MNRNFAGQRIVCNLNERIASSSKQNMIKKCANAVCVKLYLDTMAIAQMRLVYMIEQLAYL